MGENNSWRTIDDVLQTFQQVSTFKGTKAFQIPPPRSSRHRGHSSSSQGSRLNGLKGSIDVDPTRQDFLKQQLIREACGPGYSNELIEYHWGTRDVSNRAAQMLGLPAKQVESMNSLEVLSDPPSPVSTPSNPSPLSQFGTKLDISYRAASPPSVSSLDMNMSSVEASPRESPQPRPEPPAPPSPPKEEDAPPPRCRNALIKGLLKKGAQEAQGISSVPKEEGRQPHDRPLLKGWGFGAKEKGFSMKEEDFPAL